MKIETTDGGKATAAIPGKKVALSLVQIDGRWKVDISAQLAPKGEKPDRIRDRAKAVTAALNKTKAEIGKAGNDAEKIKLMLLEAIAKETEKLRARE